MLFLINIKKLKEFIGAYCEIPENKITIKRKKKMILEQTANGDIKNKRKNVIKIEIIE